MTIRITLDDLAPVVEVLLDHGYTQVTADTTRWAWEGLSELGRSIGLIGEERRVVITADGTLIVREPGHQAPWRQVRYVECGDDIDQMTDELVAARILPWGYHTAAGRAVVALRLADDVVLSPAALDALADGRASGAGYDS